ncbi:hypothetical protein ACOSP7_029102 [Xanthoceras sorbifolium]
MGQKYKERKTLEGFEESVTERLVYMFVEDNRWRRVTHQLLVGLFIAHMSEIDWVVVDMLADQIRSLGRASDDVSMLSLYRRVSCMTAAVIFRLHF